MNEDQKEQVVKAARALLAKMEVVHADKKYQSVWTISQLHIGPYDGPNYIEELRILKEALEEQHEFGEKLGTE